MTFNSISFLVFLPIVVSGYYALPGRWRWMWLLLASCYFYMAFVPSYILILFALIGIDFFLAQQIEKSQGSWRRAYLIGSIVSNIGILFFFKYFNFFNDNVAALAHVIGWNYSIEALKFLWPLGLSFHTFQSLSYVIEVYRGAYPAEKHLGVYALYVMFFPQLVAGPIERPAQLLPQLHAVHRFEYANAVEGLRYMLRGFFKKVVIADNLAVLVDYVYAHGTTADSSVIILGIAAFTFQLYMDFSGYSDIAVGAAKMLGIDLVQNFRQPFFSRSVAEFWRRWHISLSSWFRDYVYFPFVWRYRHRGAPVEYGAILVTFALTGFWHGAGWTFLLMGFLFGFYICVGTLTKKYRDTFAAVLRITANVRVIVQTVITFLLAAAAFVFFRAGSAAEALGILWGAVSRWSAGSFHYLLCNDYCAAYAIGIGRKELLAVGAAIVAVLIYEYLQYAEVTPPSLFKRRSVRWGVYYGLVFWILLAGYFVPKTFIYFQF